MFLFNMKSLFAQYTRGKQALSDKCTVILRSTENSDAA